MNLRKASNIVLPNLCLTGREESYAAPIFHSGQEVVVILRCLPPFRLDFTVWALRRRAHNAVDRWGEDGSYRRVLSVDGQAVELHLRQEGPKDRPQLRLSFSADLSTEAEERVAASVTTSLGLQRDLRFFYALADQDSRLQALVKAFPGLKPPRYLTLWEAMVNAIACQQVTLHLGITLLNRLAENFGPSLETADSRYFGFPLPEDLGDTDWPTLRSLGFSRHKAEAILFLAQAFLTDDYRLKELGKLEDHAVIAQLCSLRGIGRWSAEYALLRGLGRIHIFPGDDVGARKHLREWLACREILDYAGAQECLARWQPYAGLIYFHLLLLRLQKEGILLNHPNP